MKVEVNRIDTFEVWRGKCNEVFEVVDTHTSQISEIGDTTGDVAGLHTSEKTIVAAINEIHSMISSISNQLGDLSALQTSDNDNLVDAINELKQRIDLI